MESEEALCLDVYMEQWAEETKLLWTERREEKSYKRDYVGRLARALVNYKEYSRSVRF